MFSVAVLSSLARILIQVQWWSVSMVTRYDVISSRLSSHFWVKVHVFSTFSAVKYCVISGRWPCLVKHHKFSCDPYSVIFLAVRWHEKFRSLAWEAGRAIASPNFSFPGIWNSRGWQIKRLVPFLQCEYKIHHTPCGHFSTKSTYVCPGVYIRRPNRVLTSTRLLPRPSRSTYLSDASETNGQTLTRTTWPETHQPLPFFQSMKRSPEQMLPLQRNVR